MIKLHESARNTAAQTKLVADFGAFVSKNRAAVEAAARKHVSSDAKNEINTRVLGGFYEEFLGSTAFTILDFRKGSEPIVTKVTSSDEQQTQTISRIARYLRGESTQLHEEILGEVIRLPVYIEPTESLDKHPVSENIAGEVGLFLASRFLNPMSSNLLERKTFFRVERNLNQARYVLNIKIRRDETRLYASLTARARDGEARRSAWIEGDVSRFSEFEEEVLAVARKTLSNIEGIADYMIGIGLDMWFDENEKSTKMYSLYFRQNLGNAALSLRARSGTLRAAEDSASISLMGAGMGFGWQIFDMRWIVGDMGLSADAGLASHPDVSGRDMWMSYGGFAQMQTNLHRNIAVIMRAGIEQPQLLSSVSNREHVFQKYYWNGLVGIGIIF
jgi:hypothetical protein